MDPLHRMILVAVALTFAACAHVPRSSKDDRALRSIRSQYLQDHPGGPHNARIEKGELAVGMNVLEVLASWGLPEQREWSARTEVWTYVSRDEFNEDYLSYRLRFVERVLTAWSLERTTSGAGSAPVATSRVHANRTDGLAEPRTDPFRGRTAAPRK